MAATLTISPSTVTPGATFTASGTAERKGGASASCRILVENIVKSTFSVGQSGKYSRQIGAPTGADRTVQVLLQQLQGTGQWVTTAPARTLTIQGSVPAPQPTIPTVPLSFSGVAGNARATLSWSAPSSNGGSALTGYIVYKNGAELTTTAAGTTTYTAVGLVNNTDYQFSGAAKNAIGTGPQTSPPITVRPVAPADTTAPVVSNLAHSSVTQTGAIISWNVSEPATGRVRYGLSPTALTLLTTAETSFDHSAHVQEVSALTANILYYYQVFGADAAGNPYTSATQSFTAAAVPEPPPPPPSTCTTTVAAGASIQAAVDAAGSGATICLTPGTVYTLSSSLNINGKTGLTLDGKGATIRTNLALGQAWPTQEIIRCSDGSNLTFRNLTIIGSHNNPGFYTPGLPEFQAGIGLIGIQGCLVEAVTVRNNMGDGVGAYGLGSTPCRDIEVRNCDFAGQGRWGVTLTHAERVWAHHNVFSNVQIAFETEADAASPAHFVNDAIFEDNTLSGQMAHMFGGYGPGTLTDVIVRRNTVAAGPNRGIWSFMQPTAGFRAVRFKFENNVGQQSFAEDPKSIIQLCNNDNAIVTGNTQPVVAGRGTVGVSQFNCTGSTVSGNTVSGTAAATATWGTCDG